MQKKRDHRHFFTYLQKIRSFFVERDFLDCLTPPAVLNPGVEVHLHPLQLYSPHHKHFQQIYLHTSPEFYMKELLAEGLDRIFTISYCFRDEPKTPYHRFQFLMLEWYRKNVHYLDLAKDCEELLKAIKGKNIFIEKKTVDDVFLDILGFRVTDFLDKKELYKVIVADFKDIYLDSNSSYDWEDLFFHLFLHAIEPHLKEYSYLILYEYPMPMHALSKIKEDNPKVCERFELYINGIEMANAFGELDCFYEQEKRFLRQNKKKRELYNYELPYPTILLEALRKGIGSCSGIALGVERAYGELFGYPPFWD